MEGRRLTVHARAYRQALTRLLAVALVIASPVAWAVPKDGNARAAFDEGIAAYQKQDYTAAAAAFGRSYELEADVETLFAWAQAERQLEHCDKAVELYQKLLEAKLPDENHRVVLEKLEECKKILAANAPEPAPTPTPTPSPAPQPMPDRPIDKGPEGKSRFKDPLGGVLLGTGVVGLAVGGYFLMSAKSADSDAKAATNYFDAERLSSDAESKGRTGVIAAIAGGALIAASIVRYTTIKPARTTVSGWLTPDGGGLAAFGRF